IWLTPRRAATSSMTRRSPGLYSPWMIDSRNMSCTISGLLRKTGRMGGHQLIKIGYLTLREESYILYDIGYSGSVDLSSGDFVVKTRQINPIAPVHFQTHLYKGDSRMRSRLSVLAMLLMVMALVLSACAPAPAAAPAAGDAAADTAADATAAESTGGEPIELRVGWWGSQNRHDRTIAVIEQF